MRHMKKMPDAPCSNHHQAQNEKNRHWQNTEPSTTKIQWSRKARMKDGNANRLQLKREACKQQHQPQQRRNRPYPPKPKLSAKKWTPNYSKPSPWWTKCRKHLQSKTIHHRRNAAADAKHAGDNGPARGNHHKPAARRHRRGNHGQLRTWHSVQTAAARSSK